MNPYFTNRRSVRHYTSKEVSDEMLNELLRGAAQAPTTGNMQLYSVIINRDPDIRRRIAEAHFNQPAVREAAVVLTFCADFNRFVKWCVASGARPGYDNFHSFMTAVLDTVIFAQQFVAAAEEEGLGTCYMGTTTYNAPMIGEILGLPELVVPVVTVTLGWPAETPEVSDRLPLESFVFNEHYNNVSAEDVRKFYLPKEEREDNRGFVEANKKQTLAQVFTDIRYPKADNERISREFLDYIVGQGFVLPS